MQNFDFTWDDYDDYHEQFYYHRRNEELHLIRELLDVNHIEYEYITQLFSFPDTFNLYYSLIKLDTYSLTQSRQL